MGRDDFDIFRKLPNMVSFVCFTTPEKTQKFLTDMTEA